MRRPNQIFQTKSGLTGTIATARGRDAKSLQTFRRALHSAAKHLNASAVEAHEGWWDVYSTLRRLQNDPKSMIGVAKLAGRIVGEVQVRGSRYRRLQHDVRLGLGVHHDFTQQGIGAALLSYAIEAMQSAEGVKRISLAVHGDNVAAQHLYRKAGFAQEGRRKGAIGPIDARNDVVVDEILMALYLDDKG